MASIKLVSNFGRKLTWSRFVSAIADLYINILRNQEAFGNRRHSSKYIREGKYQSF